MNIGDKIGKYTLVEKIGEGGMGMVFKASDEQGESVALKICKEEDESSISRFKREVRIQSKMRHKNIMPVIDYALESSTPFFVMPLAKGNVDDIITTISGDLDKVYVVFEQICEGISVLHVEGNHHRDIKPSNALIMPDGSIKVSDFGLAKMVHRDSKTHQSSNYFIGTYGYNAPEQINAKNADERTDVFQLGKTFYQMYTGEYPHLIDPKKLAPGLAYIIQKSTSPNPNDRYQTVNDFRQAIFTFKKSLNPKDNPIHAIESKLFEVDKLQKSGLYDNEVYISLLDLLGNIVDDKESFLLHFDKIPIQALRIFADQLSDRFKPFIKIYTKVLDDFFTENNVNFEYGDKVSYRMKVICDSTKIPEIKAECIRNTLRVAVWLNRFNAMDTFDTMIQQIDKDDEAGLIAQILNEEIELYEKISQRISESNLHPAINEIRKMTLPKEQPDASENPDWMDEWLTK